MSSSDPHQDWQVIQAEATEVLDSTGRLIEPQRRRPRFQNPASWILAGASVAVFIVWNVILGRPPYELGYSPAGHQIFPQLLTSMFGHFSSWHLFGNIMTAFSLGVPVERVYGSWRYAAIYLVAGLLAGLVQGWAEPVGLALGASGAVSAVIVLFGRTFPRERLYIFAAIPITGRMMIVFWAAFNIVGQLFLRSWHIAYADHLAGMFFGGLLSLLLFPPKQRFTLRQTPRYTSPR